MKNAVAAGDFVVRGPTVGKKVAAVDRTNVALSAWSTSRQGGTYRSAPRHSKSSSKYVIYLTSCLLEFCYRISPIGLSVEPAPLAGAITQQISPTHGSFPASRSLR